jgi:hypothetical protein
MQREQALTKIFDSFLDPFFKLTRRSRQELFSHARYPADALSDRPQVALCIIGAPCSAQTGLRILHNVPRSSWSVVAGRILTPSINFKIGLSSSERPSLVPLSYLAQPG